MLTIYTVERVVDLGNHTLVVFSNFEDALKSIEKIKENHSNSLLEVVAYPVLDTIEGFSERTTHNGEVKATYENGELKFA